MLDSFSLCRTTASVRAPASNPPAVAARPFSFGWLASLCLGCAQFALSGCASTDKVDVAIKPTTPLIRNDLLRLSRREYQDCVAAFYQDDWDKLKLHGQQLAGLTARWKDQRVQAAEMPKLREQTQLLESAVADLQAATEKKDVLQVTVALRRIPPCFATLEKLPGTTEAPATKSASP